MNHEAKNLLDPGGHCDGPGRRGQDPRDISPSSPASPSRLKLVHSLVVPYPRRSRFIIWKDRTERSLLAGYWSGRRPRMRKDGVEMGTDKNADSR